MSGDLAEEVVDTKRYDRQIRLWGLETQRGLTGAWVLMLGANGLSNEICKNLVLAGIGHLCIQDAGTLERAALEVGGLAVALPIGLEDHPGPWELVCFCFLVYVLDF